MADYTLKLDETEAVYIAQRARQRGYASPVEYVRALVAADALVEILRDDWQDADVSAEEIETDFREAWHDTMTGNLLPIESLWDDLDDEQ